jgi:hypothetical protein
VPTPTDEDGRLSILTIQIKYCGEVSRFKGQREREREREREKKREKERETDRQTD